MTGLSRIHFLKISGLVDRLKKNEFENTVRFACGMMSAECTTKSLSAELLFGNEYFFFTSWSTEEALRLFVQSDEYQLVRGAYDALGLLQKIEIGYNVEIKRILIQHS
jgi:hypothetical protein